MLQQILKDMYIDPDVLEALNDDQKKTLFMKMREEQVRRWKEREERLEGEGGAALKTMPKKGQRKTVSWLLGRDGDVQVCVIGDTDEIRPSKLICSQLEEQKVSNLHSNTRHQMGLRGNLENRGSSEPVRTGTERLSPTVQTGIQLHLEGDQSASNVQPNHIFQVSQTEQEPPSTEEIEDDDDDDDPSSAADDTRLYYRPHLRFSDTPSIADRLRPLISQEPNGDSLSITDRFCHQDSQEMEKGTGKELHTVSAFRRAGLEAVADGEPSVARGRVAQLRKNFGTPSSSSNSTTPRRKPPVPNKPPHLLASTSPR